MTTVSSQAREGERTDAVTPAGGDGEPARVSVDDLDKDATADPAGDPSESVADEIAKI